MNVSTPIEDCREYRVFISYSHNDRQLVERIVAILKKNGMRPTWDEDFAFGQGFHEQIKRFIAHAHVFMPIITKASSARGWVHQEIGFAMALNVPVLPVGIGALPGQMLEQLLAVRLNRELDGARKLLSPAVLSGLVSRHQDPELATYQCSQLHEERSEMMAHHAEEVLSLGATGHVRQRGALSSFHIPDRVISDKIWRLRYGKQAPSKYHCKLQRRERLALEKHARNAGCSLIVNPYLDFSRYGVEAHIVRLQCLLDFLSPMSNDQVTIAINKNMEDPENTTICGDWFAAESVSMTGPRQTNFTRHAPSMQTRIDLFEQELDLLLRKTKVPRYKSKATAVRECETLVRKLRRRSKAV
ncbi:toll/interleukin-1 receptor domain-containing protein [Pirellulales bacterium]|nr:toll/interleukin-1 receptor domain-containing protein [Pirellulales bacterium]